MTESDNGNEPEQPAHPQQGQVQLNIQVLPQGVQLSWSAPTQLGIPAEAMDNLTEEWILSRPALLLKVVQRAKAAQKQELAVITHINRSKVN